MNNPFVKSNNNEKIINNPLIKNNNNEYISNPFAKKNNNEIINSNPGGQNLDSVQKNGDPKNSFANVSNNSINFDKINNGILGSSSKPKNDDYSAD